MHVFTFGLLGPLVGGFTDVGAMVGTGTFTVGGGGDVIVLGFPGSTPEPIS